MLSQSFFKTSPIIVIFLNYVFKPTQKLILKKYSYISATSIFVLKIFNLNLNLFRALKLNELLYRKLKQSERQLFQVLRFLTLLIIENPT